MRCAGRKSKCFSKLAFEFLFKEKIKLISVEGRQLAPFKLFLKTYKSNNKKGLTIPSGRFHASLIQQHRIQSHSNHKNPALSYTVTLRLYHYNHACNQLISRLEGNTLDFSSP